MPSRKSSPRISLFDIFIGSGRTIRSKDDPPRKRSAGVAKSPSKATAKPPSNHAAAPAPGEPQPVDEAFTPEQDAQLIKMKAENKSWKDIAQEIGKPAWALKKRYPQIRPKDDDVANKEVEGHAKTAEKKQTDQGEKKRKAKAKKDHNDGASGVGGDQRGEQRFTLPEYQMLTEDDLFSFGEIQCISELLDRDEETRWIRIAGAFYDRTGRRIDPEDIHEKFNDLALAAGR
ncbi:hypothetical protein LTR66_008003 [Elasticomyces elasticus]|nr:hypothetical protein LTR66_008003 [Elasticomyces elasticus]